MTWRVLGIAVLVGGLTLVSILSRTPPRQRLMWIGVVIATTLISIALALSTAEDESDPEFCADEGVLTQTGGSTPEGAMAVYVASVGGDPDDWEHAGDGVFHPVDASAEPPGLESILAAEIEPGTWQVTGTCVDVGYEP